MSKIQIDHIGIAVKKIEPLKKVLTEYFGGVNLDQEKYKEYNLISQMIKFDNTNIELMESIDDTGLIAKFIKKRGEGLHHISILVDSIEEKIAELKQEDYEISGDILVTQKGDIVQKVAFLNPKQMNNILIELKEETVNESLSVWKMIDNL
ncbi:MAG: VOC family protein [Halanaerobiales bacterium]|nr:VOC family protein [Halanaerobiales bacterium]